VHKKEPFSKALTLQWYVFVLVVNDL